jgi:uncharacterized protein YoxC
MRYRIGILLLLSALASGLYAQLPDTRRIRIVDTLTAQEKATRNPVILKSELDSLIKLHDASIIQIPVQQPVKEPANNFNQYILAGLVAIIAFLCLIVYMFYRHQKKINKTIAGLNKKTEHKETTSTGTILAVATKEKSGKTKLTAQSLESKINDLNAELHKLSKENEGLNRVIKEYNGIQHEYDSLKHGMLKAYKVKNYPGYDKTKDDTLAMQGVLETENAVANYAYEKFLKPILTITDANKNSPAKLSAEDQERLLDLLVSLSLLYIEYLYLRVNDLAIGGKMVERISHLSKGNGPDPLLLKKMNTEFGSRALVIRMALNKTALQQLSYPVFDETNLNNQ